MNTPMLVAGTIVFWIVLLGVAALWWASGTDKPKGKP